jgi:uncharacterized membrane protein (Fun14 family)
LPWCPPAQTPTDQPPSPPFIAQAVGRTLAAFLGFSFVGLQLLTYSGVVTVNWTKVHEQARRVLDATGDG